MSPKVLILFYSRTGNVAALAEGIAEGARAVGAEVKLARVHDIAPEAVIEGNPAWKASRDAQVALYPEPEIADLEWADAVIWGSPTRFGNMSAELKSFIDRLAGVWLAGSLLNKVGAVFTSTASLHGGNEATLLTMMVPLMHLGFVIVPNGYGDPAMFAAGTPYGSSAVVGGMADQPPTEADLAVARYQGRRVTEVTGWMLKGRS